MGERAVTEHLLTPSKITAWLDCAHFLTLRHEVDDGLRQPAAFRLGEMAQLLLEKGLTHEREVLTRYRSAGRSVFEVPPRNADESFAGWVARVRPVLEQGHDVLYQMPFVHEGVRGIADFLERVENEGVVSYEPVDAKLARAAAKPGHVLQLCFYAEAIAATTGRPPARLHVELGSGARESIRASDVLPYWRRQRRSLAALLEEPPDDTVPEPCDHCAFCEFEPVCDAEWRAADSLVYVAGIRRSDRALLAAAEVHTLAGLAAAAPPVVDGIDAERLHRLVRQASLQARAREEGDTATPPYELVPSDDTADVPSTVDRDNLGDPTDGGQGVGAVLVGFAALPEPDEGDVFLDFEGHPFWRADVGLFFLFGLIEREGGEWRYREFWAHDRTEEARATADLVEHLTARRARFPGMHVYHYNHTERTALTRLTRDHAVAELELEQLVGTGAFVDLYPVVTGAVQIGTESYGLKHVERLTDFTRGHEIDRGASAVVEYEHWTADRDPARLIRIARYNEDDVRATRAVRDWLVAHRPEGPAWRPAVLDPEAGDPELDARIEALHAYGLGTPEHLMGDLLGYWRRERRVVAADCLRLSTATADEQRESPAAIAGLEFRGLEERVSERTGKPVTPWAVFTFPPQPVDPDIRPRSTMIVALQPEQWVFFTVMDLDREAGRLAVAWNQAAAERGLHPSALVHYGYVREGAKATALCALADRMLAGDTTGAGLAILRRDPPAFRVGHGPRDGVLVGGYQDVCAWVPHLNGSFLPVQGPPGTGKTFTGAHVIHDLVTRGKRVGVTAMSHHAIDNLLQAVAERFAAAGDDLRAVHKAERGGSVPGIEYHDTNAACATGSYDVVAGTPWLFAHDVMRDNPVDVLVVDEAGQLGLADTLAATVSTTDVVLLGDPQQLPQVSQASHPNGSGASALEHLLGEGVRTFPPDRGVLLDVTWRMHPDICDFVSEVMYDGRLTSHADCAAQTTAGGTGLRWIRADHTGRSTESPEEAALVRDTVVGLLGTPWTDHEGASRPLTVDDVIVVTPYNDQRRLIEATLAEDHATAGVQVGTVDKFQGREAAVVIFSMTTSSADFMPRDADFLFSKNRLNVAVSRARCLAYLICTDALLDTRARDVEQMTLLSALCAFVEHARPIASLSRPPV